MWFMNNFLLSGGGGLSALKALKSLKSLKALKSLKSMKALKSLKSLKVLRLLKCAKYVDPLLYEIKRWLLRWLADGAPQTKASLDAKKRKGNVAAWRAERSLPAKLEALKRGYQHAKREPVWPSGPRARYVSFKEDDEPRRPDDGYIDARTGLRDTGPAAGTASASRSSNGTTSCKSPTLKPSSTRPRCRPGQTERT